MKHDSMSKVKCEAYIKQKNVQKHFMELSIACAISFILLMVFIILLILGISNITVWIFLFITAFIFLVTFGFWLDTFIKSLPMRETIGGFDNDNLVICYDRESKIELDIRFNKIERIIAKEPVKKYSQLEIHLFNEEVITIDKVWHPNELVEIFKMIKNNNYKL